MRGETCCSNKNGKQDLKVSVIGGCDCKNLTQISKSLIGKRLFNFCKPAGGDGDDHGSEDPACRLPFFQKKIGRRQAALLDRNIGEHVPDWKNKKTIWIHLRKTCTLEINRFNQFKGSRDLTGLAGLSAGNKMLPNLAKRS